MAKGIILLMSIICILTSCEKFEISEQGDITNYANINVSYNWDGILEKKDNEIYVIAARLNDTHHTYFVTDSNSLFLYECPYSSFIEDNIVTNDTIKFNNDSINGILSDDSSFLKENEDTIVNSDTIEVIQGKETFKVLSGSYSLIAVSKGSSTYIEPIVDFVLKPLEIGMKDLNMVYADLKNDMMPILGGKPWVDRNPGYKFINNSGAKFIGHIGNAQMSADGAFNNYTFTMRKLTQKVRFIFDINITSSDADSIHVGNNAIISEISGVIPSINLVDETMSTNSLKRMFLAGKTSSKSNDARNSVYTYEGCIDAFGLIAGPDNQVISGPGILRIGLEISIIDKNGETRNVILSATKNICDEINAAHLTTIVDEYENRKQQVKETTIKINSELSIDADAIITGDSDAIKGWDESFIEEEI